MIENQPKIKVTMPRLRFSVSTLILGVLIASLIFALIYQISINSKLREDNRSMRDELGLPEIVVPGKFFVSRATADFVLEENSWIWRVIVPEGVEYRLLAQTKNIPTTSEPRYPKNGIPILRIGPGETLLRARIIKNGADSILLLERNGEPFEFKFDGRFLDTPPRTGATGLSPWQTPPDESWLFQAYLNNPKKIHDIDGEPHAEVGLQFWLERVEDDEEPDSG